MVKFTTKIYDNFTLIEFAIPDNVCSPEELKELDLPGVDSTKGVIISGRGPVWLFGRLIHHYHPTAWVATFDPRLGGGVVVASHTRGVEVGEVITVESGV